MYFCLLCIYKISFTLLPLKPISPSFPQKRLRKSCRNICPKPEPVAGPSCIVGRNTHSKLSLWGALRDSRHFGEALWAQLCMHQPGYCERETEKSVTNPNALLLSSPPTSTCAPLPPAATFPKTNREGRGPLMQRLKRFPQLDLRQQVKAARSPLSTREASHCSRAGLSGDPGGQLSEGCHWFVTDDKWGRSRSHHRLQRGRLPQRPAGERGGKWGNADPMVEKIPNGYFSSNELQQKGATVLRQRQGTRDKSAQGQCSHSSVDKPSPWRKSRGDFFSLLRASQCQLGQTKFLQNLSSCSLANCF